MKIAIIRGDFASVWELQNFKPLALKHKITLFTGLAPIADLSSLNWLKIQKLPSPVDLNFGKISHLKMAVLNRLFIDAHYLFGLEKKLQNYDIAYCAETYYSYTHQCLRARKLGYIKKIISIVWENIAHNNEGILGRKALKKRVIVGVDKFVAITDRAKEVLIAEGCDPAKIIRASPGVDLNHFRPLPKVKCQKVKLLFVGRLVEEKGIRDILRIFKQINEKYPQTELVIVGDGPLKNEIKGGGINFLGSISYSEMPKIYSSCDIYVHYSKGSKTWVEQYGFTLIEAMVCGLPVVGLDCGSVKEVVGPGGLISDVKNFAKNLETLIKNKNKRIILGKIAISFARKNYDSYKYGQTLEKIFKS